MKCSDPTSVDMAVPRPERVVSLRRKLRLSDCHGVEGGGVLATPLSLGALTCHGKDNQVSSAFPCFLVIRTPLGTHYLQPISQS